MRQLLGHIGPPTDADSLSVPCHTKEYSREAVASKCDVLFINASHQWSLVNYIYPCHTAPKKDYNSEVKSLMMQLRLTSIMIVMKNGELNWNRIQ